MKKKKKRLLTVAVAVFFASLLLIPGKALASDIKTGSITAGDCKDGCQGHHFGDGSSTPNRIFVESGEHTIYINNLKLNHSTQTEAADKEVFRIGSGATVHLVLQGDNELYSGTNVPGIIVPTGAKLDIAAHKDDPDATLTVNSAATRGSDVGAAGIGGGPAEGDSSVGDITIISGNIKAMGRGTYPGIGSIDNSGSVYVLGGTISAEDKLGSASNNKAIQCGTISSNTGTDAGHFSIIKGTVSSRNNSLNALVSPSKDDDKNFLLYGDVVIENQDAGGSGWGAALETIRFSSKDSSLTLPVNSVLWPNNCNKNSSGDLIFQGNDDGSPCGTLIYTEGSGVLAQSDIDTLKRDKGIESALALTAQDFMIQDSLSGILGPPYGTYTGFAQAANSVLVANEYRNGLPVESTRGWTPTILNSSGQKSEFKDADTYSVTFTKGARTVDLTGVIIYPRELTDNMTISIPDQVYTGQEVSPQISASYQGYTLTPFNENDSYDINITQNGSPVSSITEAGSYDLELTGKGNFAGTYNGTFVVAPAAIREVAEVSITVDGNDILDDVEDDFVYTQTEKNVQIALTYNGNPLVEGTDYTVTYSGTNFQATPDKTAADFTNAGTVTITIEGITNYQGQVTHSFEIRKKEVALQDVTAISRTYNGTNIVEIGSAEIRANDILGTDNVSIAPAATSSSPVLTAMVDEADIGTYTVLIFNAADVTAKFSGAQSGNYALTGNENGQYKFTLTGDKKVVISTASLGITPELKKLGENMYKPDKNYEFFEYTAQVNNPITEPQFGHTIEYEYKIEGGEWQDSPDFSGLEPDKERLFYVRTKAVWPEGETTRSDPDTRANIAPSAPGALSIDFLRLSQEAPDIPNLTFEQNEGSPTFTATINLGRQVPEIPGVEYSFDGKNFSDENTKGNCTSGTEYIGYVRFKETKTHLPGNVAQSVPVVAPQLMVSKPVISPGSKPFLAGYSVDATISCSTPSATMYYTTDGKEPVPGNSNTFQYDGNPIHITETTTIRVIATEPEMMSTEGEAVTYNMITTSDAHTQYVIQKIDPDHADSYEIPETLINEGMDGIDAITAALFNAIIDSPKSKVAAFNYLNMEYFDIKIQFSADGLTDWVDATAENFPPEGVTVSLTDETLARHSESLKDVDKNTHIFLASHMFTEFYGDWVPGNVEVLDVTETETGLEFTVNGASPMAVAWAVGQNPTPGGDNNNGNNNGNGDGTDTPADGNNDPNSDNSNTDNTANANGRSTNVASEAGTNTTGTGTGTGTNSKTDPENGTTSRAQQYLASLPVTGDTASLLLWSALGAISLGVLAFAIVKIRRHR